VSAAANIGRRFFLACELNFLQRVLREVGASLTRADPLVRGLFAVVLVTPAPFGAP
jgi:hypothetical protein